MQTVPSLNITYTEEKVGLLGLILIACCWCLATLGVVEAGQGPRCSSHLAVAAGLCTRAHCPPCCRVALC